MQVYRAEVSNDEELTEDFEGLCDLIYDFLSSEGYLISNPVRIRDKPNIYVGEMEWIERSYYFKGAIVEIRQFLPDEKNVEFILLDVSSDDYVDEVCEEICELHKSLEYN